MQKCKFELFPRLQIGNVVKVIVENKTFNCLIFIFAV